MGGTSQRTDLMTYFIQTYGEGDDAVGNTDKGVISIANSFLSSYDANGSVGDFVTADVSVEALNIRFEDATDEFKTRPLTKKMVNFSMESQAQ